MAPRLAPPPAQVTQAELDALETQVDAVESGQADMADAITAIPAIRRKTITLDTSPLAADAANVVVPIDLRTDADIANKALADWSDVTFHDASTGAQLGHVLDGVDRSYLSADMLQFWFQDPGCICHEGVYRKLYTGGVDNRGAIWAASRDLDSGQTDVFLLDWFRQRDDHSAPTVGILPDGTVMYVLCGHGGPFTIRKSTRPEDITAFGAEYTALDDLTVNGYSYPNLVYLSAEERWYLFGRRTGADFNPGVAWSDDDGATWRSGPGAPGVMKQMLAIASERPYVKVISNGVDRIDFFYTDCHPDEVFTPSGTSSLYHCYYQSGGLGAEPLGSLRQSNGTVIALLSAAAPNVIDTTRVYDAVALGRRAWVWDLALDEQGLPVIVFATLPGTFDPVGYANHRYHWGRWTGSAWITTQVCLGGTSIYSAPLPGGPPYVAAGAGATVTQPSYSGGIVLDHSSPRTTVFVSSNADTTQHEIARYVTLDDGATWTRTQITRDSGPRKQIRPFCPRGRSAGCPEVFWNDGFYDDYLTYRMGIRCWPPFPGADGRYGAHVLVPAVTAGADKTLEVRYGTGRSAPVVPSAVPSGLKLAYSMADIDLAGQGVSELTRLREDGAKDLLESSSPWRQTAGLQGAAQNLPSGRWIKSGVLSMAGWTGLTVCATLKVPNLTLNPNYLISNSIAGQASFYVRVSNAGAFTVFLVLASGQIGGSFTTAGGAALAADGNYHFICLVYNGATMRLWLDDVQISTSYAGTGPLDPDASIAPVYVGYHSPGLVQGDVDCDALRIWDRGLTDAEIRAQKLVLTSPTLASFGAEVILP